MIQTNFKRIFLESLGALWCLLLSPHQFTPTGSFLAKGLFSSCSFWICQPCPTFHKINYIKQPLTLLKVWQYFGSIQGFAGRRSLGLLYPFRIMNCVVALISKSVPFLMGKCIVISGILLRFQVAGKHHKQAGNQTATDFFWFYFSSILIWM